MGMKQVRCPLCRKKRRQAEPSNTDPKKQWTYKPGVGKICFVCADKETSGSGK